jgi:uncharacterized membrane protein
MAGAASIGKHPIHTILVPFPIGLLVFSLIADVVFLAQWGGPIWHELAFYTMAGGVVGALLAAVPGLVDFMSLREPKVARIAAAHLSLNVVVVGIFVVDLWLRTRTLPGDRLPVVCSVVGVVLLAASGWLGGEMVFVHGVGVEPPAPTGDMHIRTESRPESRRA